MDDEIQDLRELETLFNTNAAALERVGVDVAKKSRRAASTASELEGLLAERPARGAKHGKEPVETRDRVASHRS